GCGSMATESCVCTSVPACCQAVWSAQCVELAIACGDPFCVDDPATTGEGSTGDPLPPLECDAGFSFAPVDPAAGVAFDAMFSDPDGLPWVGMTAEDEAGGIVIGQWGGVDPGFTWTHHFSGLAAGVWTFRFTYRDTENGPDIVRGSCQKQL
ncbi:MAG: hypothetical protein K0V04_36285, partial [Deltaproteobacteria bacterium]|nr:hypothetical protein [Deltaproteobacteria bacterium]